MTLFSGEAVRPFCLFVFLSIFISASLSAEPIPIVTTPGIGVEDSWSSYRDPRIERSLVEGVPYYVRKTVVEFGDSRKVNIVIEDHLRWVSQEAVLVKQMSYVVNEALVVLKPGYTRADLAAFVGTLAVLNKYTTIREGIDSWGIYRLRVGSLGTQDLNAYDLLKTALESSPIIDLISRNNIPRPSTTRYDEPIASKQWAFESPSRHPPQTFEDRANFNSDANIIQARGIATHFNLKPVIVAVLDSGMTTDLDRFKDRLWVNSADPINSIDDDGNGLVDDYQGWNFVREHRHIFDRTGHGSHVSGIIAMKPRLNRSLKGVAPNAVIMPITILDQGGTVFDAAQGIEYAVRMGAEVINHSWGAEDDNDDVLSYALRKAEQYGVFQVSAAGNSGSNRLPLPCRALSVGHICVTSHQQDGEPSDFSNYALNPTPLFISAPGSGIWSLRGDGADKIESGTSMAAPHVSGAIALLKGMFPNESLAQIAFRVRNGARYREFDLSYGKKLDVLYSIIKQGKDDGYCNISRVNNFPFANSRESGVDGGSDASAFTICTKAQLEQIKGRLDKFFSIKADIVMRGQFFSIAAGDGEAFEGELDGNGFGIYGLSGAYPLFRSIGQQGRIKNLHLIDADIENQQVGTGILTKFLYGSVDTVTLSGRVIGRSSVGSIAGFFRGGDIRNVYVDVYAEGASKVGAVVGSNESGQIIHTNAHGSIRGQSYIGGIAGYMRGGRVLKSASSANVKGQTRVGGIAGGIECNSSLGDIYSVGRVIGSSEAGGIIGYGEISTVERTYFSGYLEYNGWDIGGFAGAYSDIITGNCNFDNGNHVLANNYFNIIGNPYNGADSGIGSWVHLLDLKSFSNSPNNNFDFNTVWEQPNDKTPSLQNLPPYSYIAQPSASTLPGPLPPPSIGISP